jgi:hypothetical protein
MASIEGDPILSALSPMERLTNILTERRIRGTKKHWGLGHPSAALPSLRGRACWITRPSTPYAIGFTKSQLWARGGQPAVYLRSEILHAIKDHVEREAKQKVYPASPPEPGTLYTPFEREEGWKLLDGTVIDTHIDYAHEREWRVPDDFEFAYEDIKFLIVETFADISKLPDATVRAVGERSILSMSNYRRIEELWPTHR